MDCFEDFISINYVFEVSEVSLLSRVSVVNTVTVSAIMVGAIASG
jgi:hypothetical protein